jgi:hypothetical protein
MARHRLKTIGPSRLNRDRVAQLRSDNPQRTLLDELASGMWVPVPDAFVPNGQNPPTSLRATYTAVAPALNRMLGDIVHDKLAFLITYETAKKSIPNLHLCKAHWTRKKGKPSGRPLGDLTYVDGTPLNTLEMADAAALHYGAILHPAVENISEMVAPFGPRSRPPTQTQTGETSDCGKWTSAAHTPCCLSDQRILDYSP